MFLVAGGLLGANIARADADDALFVTDVARHSEFAAALRVELAPRVVREVAPVVDARTWPFTRAHAMRALLEREGAGVVVWLEPGPSPLAPPIVHVLLQVQPLERSRRLAQPLEALEPRLFAIEAAALIADALLLPPHDNTSEHRERPRIFYKNTRFFVLADVGAFTFIDRDPTFGPAFWISLGRVINPSVDLEVAIAYRVALASNTEHILDISPVGVAIRLPLAQTTLQLGLGFGASVSLPMEGDSTARVACTAYAAWHVYLSSVVEAGPRLSMSLLSPELQGKGTNANRVLTTLSLGFNARLRF